jgi:hypothetical protein
MLVSQQRISASVAIARLLCLVVALLKMLQNQPNAMKQS